MIPMSNLELGLDGLQLDLVHQVRGLYLQQYAKMMDMILTAPRVIQPCFPCRHLSSFFRVKFNERRGNKTVPAFTSREADACSSWNFFFKYPSWDSMKQALLSMLCLTCGNGNGMYR